MGLPADEPGDARRRDGAGGQDDRGHAPPRRGQRHAAARALHGLIALALAGPLAAEPIRVATFATELSRDGPGLLLRDILKGEDPQIAAVVAVIARARPDILLLTGIDYDQGGVTLAALADRIAAAGHPLPHRFASRPNTGRPTGLDLDGDGRAYRARDAQGWGLYQGQGGLALLSRWPIDAAAARDLSTLLWRDLPGARLPETEAGPYYGPEALDVLRLSHTAHWDVPVAAPGGPLHILAFAAGPPVFDGPEDRNGRRTADEIRLWQLYLDGTLAPRFGPPPERFVLLGTANTDPADGDGPHDAIAALLADPALRDPRPRSDGALAAPSPGQHGDPALDTVDWWEEDDGPGNLRVDYALPAAGLRILASGVLWTDPATDPAQATEEATASRHRLVWVDVESDP